MQKTRQEKTVVELLHEHEDLRAKIADLREFIASPQPKPRDRKTRPWAADLSTRVATLHQKLVRHFRSEENAEELEELALRHPRASTRIEAFQQDHSEILERMRGLLKDTLECSAGEGPGEATIGRRLTSILEKLGRHEREETEWMSRLQTEDIGTGD